MQYTYLRHLKVEMVVTHNPRRGGAGSMLGKPYQYTFQLWQSCGGPHLWVTHFQWSAADALYGQKHLQDRYHLWRYMLDVSTIKKISDFARQKINSLRPPNFWLILTCSTAIPVWVRLQSRHERKTLVLYIYLFICLPLTHAHTYKNKLQLFTTIYNNNYINIITQ